MSGRGKKTDGQNGFPHQRERAREREQCRERERLDLRDAKWVLTTKLKKARYLYETLLSGSSPTSHLRLSRFTVQRTDLSLQQTVLEIYKLGIISRSCSRDVGGRGTVDVRIQ